MVQALRAWQISPKLIGRLEKEINRRSTAGAEPQATAHVNAGEWIDEDTAYRELSARWGVSPYWRKFRDLMRDRHAIRRSTRFGKVSFGADEIRLLSENYYSVEQLRRSGTVTRAGLSKVLKSEGVIMIGRLALVPKNQVADMVVRTAERAALPSSDSSLKTSEKSADERPRPERLNAANMLWYKEIQKQSGLRCWLKLTRKQPPEL